MEKHIESLIIQSEKLKSEFLNKHIYHPILLPFLKKFGLSITLSMGSYLLRSDGEDFHADDFFHIYDGNKDMTDVYKPFFDLPDELFNEFHDTLSAFANWLEDWDVQSGMEDFDFEEYAANNGYSECVFYDM